MNSGSTSNPSLLSPDIFTSRNSSPHPYNQRSGNSSTIPSSAHSPIRSARSSTVTSARSSATSVSMIEEGPQDVLGQLWAAAFAVTTQAHTAVGTFSDVPDIQVALGDERVRGPPGSRAG